MKPLSAFVFPAWLAARSMPASIRSLPARERAGLIAIETWGARTVAGAAELVNIAALADAARERLVVHQLRADTAELVDATDLRSTPTEPPPLMRGPWIVEPEDIAHPLAGGLLGCGAYELDGRTFVVTLTADGGAQTGEATLHWDSELGATLEDHGASEAGLLGVTREQWEQPLCQGIRTALVLGLLLGVERGPVGSHDARARAPRNATRDARRAADAWVTRTCTVRPGALRGSPVAATGPVDTRGLAAIEAPVRGHLKRQPHGPKSGDRKYIWVESYEARRWVAPATKVRV